jgi:hypothetical protein
MMTKKAQQLETTTADSVGPATKWRKLDSGRVDEGASQFPKQVDDVICLPRLDLISTLTSPVFS